MDSMSAIQTFFRKKGSLYSTIIFIVIGAIGVGFSVQNDLNNLKEAVAASPTMSDVTTMKSDISLIKQLSRELKDQIGKQDEKIDGIISDVNTLKTSVAKITTLITKSL